MAYRHLKPVEKEAIVALVAQTGYAELLRLLGGMIRNEVPNVLASWQDGSNAWADDVRHKLCMMAHEVWQRIDNPEQK